LKDYYSILGVNRSASHAEIKRAFRQLAVTYHPDKNPDPEAEQIFKEVNEAYEIIGDPEKKRDYDYRLDNPFGEILVHEVEEEQPRHRDPAYKRRRPPDPNRKSENQEIREMMLGASGYTRAVLWVSLIFCFFLLLDYTFPVREVQATVLDVKDNAAKRSYRGSADVSMTVHTDQNITFRVDLEHVDHFKPGTVIDIHVSRMLGVPLSVKSMEEVIVPVPVNIYGNFLFAPLTLVAASAAGLLFRKRIELSFNLAVASFLVLILVMVLLLLNL
jgi:hypothetical protein